MGPRVHPEGKARGRRRDCAAMTYRASDGQTYSYAAFAITRTHVIITVAWPINHRGWGDREGIP